MILHAAANAAVTFDPSKSVSNLRVLAVSVLGLALIMVSVVSVFSHGRRGDTHRSWNVASASLLGLLPAAVGFAGIGIALGSAFLGWVIPGLNS